jgi:hypothetical protein
MFQGERRLDYAHIVRLRPGSPCAAHQTDSANAKCCDAGTRKKLAAIADNDNLIQAHDPFSKTRG